MSSSASKSETSSQTTSVQEDNRVVGEGGSVALGRGAGLIINNDFGENVLDAFKDLVQLSRDAGELSIRTTQIAQEAATGAISNAQKAAQQSVSAITTAIERDKAGTATAWTDLAPLLIGAVVLIVVFNMIFNKGK